MYRKILTAELFAVLAICVWIGVSEAAVSDISSGIVRLHILANSDSEEDQRLKTDVRDRILAYVREQNEGCEKLYMLSHLEEILAVCREEIAEQGYSYAVRAETGRFYFPTKHYQQITLPAGEYDAVRIMIGEGRGQNWWCVMYPPLCFTHETRGELTEEEMAKLAEGMRAESFGMIADTEEKIKLKPALRLVEWWQEAKHALKK